MLLLLLPAVAARVFRPATATSRVWWMWVGLVLLVGLVLTLSRGAWLALAIALAISPLLAARLTWRRRALTALAIVAALVVAGWMVGRWVPAARERVAQLVSDGGERTRPFMWTGAWRLWLDAPVTGNGAGSYNLLFERHRVEGFRDEPLWAHNEYLNLLADYGLIGALLAGGAVMAIVAGCRRSLEASGSRAWPAAGIGLGLLAFVLQMTFEFHLKIPGLALAVAAAAGLAVARVWPIKESESSQPAPRWPWSHVGCLALAAWFLGERPRAAAEARRAPARAALDGLASRPTGDADYARVLPKARDDLVVATRLHPGNAQSWADLSYATALTAFVSPERTADLGREAEAAADAAIRLCPLAGEY
ncbi:MAG: O-antigen ligase family protein, partial [Opitutaceae bacterium]